MSELESELGLGRKDYEYDTITQIYDGVSFTRGLGDSGRQVLIVEKDCEKCGHDRQVQVIDVNPELRDQFSYHCQNPICPDFHDGDIPGIRRL